MVQYLRFRILEFPLKVHRKLCTYRHQHMFSGKPFSCRTCTQRFPFLHIVALLPLLLWRSFAQLSLKLILHSCQTSAVRSHVRGLRKTITLHGRVWSCARNVIFSRKKLHKAYVGGFEKKCQRPCWNLFADSILLTGFP